MKRTNVKLKISTITLILVLTISALMATAITVQAQERTIVEYDTFAYIIVTPNPIGVSQTAYVQFRIDKVSPTTIGQEGGDHFEGFTVELTRPDGETETQGPFTTDSTSGSWFPYAPNMIGDYTLQAKFPGQWINGTAGSMFGPPTDLDRWYKPSESAVVTLTVQEDPIASWPDIPLPTGYWERPVSAENKGWWQIMDNWLMPSYDRTGRMFHWSPAYAPYTSAPNSAHVLWTRPFRFGGIVGGQFEDASYYTGLSYEEPLPNKLILNGRLIYTERTHGSDSNGAFSLGGFMYNYGTLGTRIVDLYTGEDIMYLNNTIIAFAQTLAYDSSNQHGITPHLWQSIPGGYNVYDAFTAAYMFTINGVPGGTTAFGPDGEVLVYGLGNGQLTLWNSTKAILTVSQPRWGVMVREEYYNIPIGAQINGTLGIEWTVSVPDIGVSPGISLVNVKENVIIAASEDASGYPTIVTEVAYPAMLNRDSSGNYPTSINHLWVETRQDIYADTTGRSENLDGGVYAAWDEAKAELHGYSALTGEKLWSTGQIPSAGLITFSHNLMVAYGQVIISGYDGHVRAFHANNGTLAWDYYKGSAGYEVPFGTWPDYGGFTMADGKIYVSADDHSPESVIWRGASLWCVDAYTGEELWKLPGMLRQPVVSDGILVAGNSYDGLMYAVGKGSSATTVSAPQTALPKGSRIIITGSVLDMSPGQPGTPAISDEDMGAWMGYLHQQKPMPEDATGVTVKLSAYDPNGNYQDIGEATTDMAGNFGLSWLPPVEGDYYVKAEFEGTKSYGNSYATTYFTVGPAPSPYPTVEIPPYPGYQGPSAGEVAQNVLDNLPVDPTADDIAQEVLDQLPEYPETPEAQDYTNIFIAIIAAIAVVAVLVVYTLYTVKKQK